MTKKTRNIFLLIFFAIILLLPVLDNIFSFSPVKNLFEKRRPNPLPESPRSISSLPDYFKNFEAFFNDHYGFRKSLILANGKIMDNVFNESPSARALIGKDGWLFFDNQNSILDAQGLLKSDEKKIATLARHLIKNWRDLRAKNINYVLVIAADKSSIYPEFLPDFVKFSNSEHRADALLKVLKAIDKNFPVIDLRPILLSEKENQAIYHKTDTHWNRRGAYFGYVEIMKEFGLAHRAPQEFVPVEAEKKDGDIAAIMGLEIVETNYELRPKFARSFEQLDATDAELKLFHKPIFYKNYDRNLPVLFAYKDSFFDNLMEFFADSFSGAYFVNEFPCDLDLKIIKKYHANFVVQEFWEARIDEVAGVCE